MLETVALGTVSSYDEHRGLGIVASDDGEELSFHCTGLSDGSRKVAVGARVAFDARTGRDGKLWASQIEKLGT